MGLSEPNCYTLKGGVYWLPLFLILFKLLGWKNYLRRVVLEINK